MVLQLISAGADVNSLNSQGKTPIQLIILPSHKRAIIFDIMWPKLRLIYLVGDGILKTVPWELRDIIVREILHGMWYDHPSLGDPEQPRNGWDLLDL